LLKLESGKNSTDLLVPLAKDIDELSVYLNSDGNPTIAESGAGLMCFPYDGKWHFSKNYGPHAWNDNLGISLSWSYNSFARYTLDILSRLEGKTPKENDQYFFGQIFDVIGNKK